MAFLKLKGPMAELKEPVTNSCEPYPTVVLKLPEVINLDELYPTDVLFVPSPANNELPPTAVLKLPL